MKKYFRPLLLLLMVSAIIWFYVEGGNEYLRFEYLKSRLTYFQGFYTSYPLAVMGLFFGSIVFLASLSIPGSIVITVLSGAIFGVLPGAILVTAATTLGASIAFLMARFLFKDWVSRKFNKRFMIMNQRIQEEGLSYLFTLRLFPASPFVVINLVMGLTPMRLFTFSWITFVGMFPGTFIYVYAGRKITELNSIAGIMSPPIIISLLALSIFPYVLKTIIRSRKQYATMQKEQLMNHNHEHKNKYYSVSGVEFEGEDMAKFTTLKGTTRSDDSIRREASEILYEHSDIESGDIELMVVDGRIYLRGSVETRYMKNLAQESLEKIEGVKDVINQLNIRSIGLVKDIQGDSTSDLSRDEELKSHKMG
ncbi:MAG TPA: VTT domain-containing protein [Bacteriovoracaceae bacterium]|nr:VTT domain-containing protein [Bacteriovoracaceae bacterium]